MIEFLNNHVFIQLWAVFFLQAYKVLPYEHLIKENSEASIEMVNILNKKKVSEKKVFEKNTHYERQICEI